VGERPPEDQGVRRVAVRAAAILGTGVGAGAFIAIGWESPVRVVLALVFLLFGPGLAVAELMEVRDLVQRLAIAAGVSLAVESLVALALLYAGAYSVGLTFAIVLALSAMLLGIALLRASRASAPRTDNSRVAA
jgi:uncharacterized membrane protein